MKPEQAANLAKEGSQTFQGKSNPKSGKLTDIIKKLDSGDVSSSAFDESSQSASVNDRDQIAESKPKGNEKPKRPMIKI